jgi:MFS family permease
VRTGRDLFYLYAARAARGFGDGFAAILLPAYLSELGYDVFQIGVVTAAALLGSALITLAIGFLSSHFHKRTLLFVCAALMILTGVGIPTVPEFAFLLAIVFIGTINPTTGDIGYHVPLEQASLAQRASDDDRTRILARYSLIGALAIAAGALVVGAPDLLTSFGLRRIDAIRIMFYLYAFSEWSARRSTRACRPPRSKRQRSAMARPWALRAGQSIGLRRCSASTRLRAASRFSRFSHSGSSSASTSRWRPRAHSSSGRICCPLFPIRSRRAWASASAS